MANEGFRLRFPSLEMQCSPGGDWNPTWGYNRRTGFTGSLCQAPYGHFPFDNAASYKVVRIAIRRAICF